MRSAMAKWLEYGPTGGLAGWRRGFAIAAVAAVFLAVSGAFGMGQLSLLERLAGVHREELRRIGPELRRLVEQVTQAAQGPQA